MTAAERRKLVTEIGDEVEARFIRCFDLRDDVAEIKARMDSLGIKSVRGRRHRLSVVDGAGETADA